MLCPVLHSRAADNCAKFRTYLSSQVFLQPNKDMLCGQTYPFDAVQVVRAPAVLVGNSAGGLAALQAAATAPHLVRGLVLLACTMRRMHERNQPPFVHPFVKLFQWMLHETPVGRLVVDHVLKTPGKLKEILERCEQLVVCICVSNILQACCMLSITVSSSPYTPWLVSSLSRWCQKITAQCAVVVMPLYQALSMHCICDLLDGVAWQ